VANQTAAKTACCYTVKISHLLLCIYTGWQCGMLVASNGGLKLQ
jgi:hypothetical protein